MPSLGLGTKTTNSGLITPGIVTDNLVLKHKYDAGSVIPVSDGAVYFDGDDYISTTLPGSTFHNDFTISAWVYRIEEDQFHTILGVNDGSNDECRLYFQKSSSGSDLILAIGPDATSGATRYIHATTPWSGNYFNKWVHIAATYKDGEQKIYINGADDTDSSTTPTRTTNLNLSADAFIGSLSAGSSHDMLGYICNVGIWSSVLTQAQIKSIMNKNYAGLTDSEKTNLVSWWNLDPASVTTGESSTYTADSHGSNTGTLT